MRKLIAGLSLVFVVAVAAGFSMNRATAGPCYYKCICSRPYKCCLNNGVESCKPATGIQCTQVYPC